MEDTHGLRRQQAIHVGWQKEIITAMSHANESFLERYWQVFLILFGAFFAFFCGTFK
ncbi:hypothetical protein [Terriglobus albidus]|uniref:hypothetical protein n=1 Tax=Terriglobus albidus TaxID=1592106 RepID=UPI0021DF79E5|nr:hypothetical protein [Terriglobus albidus]